MKYVGWFGNSGYHIGGDSIIRLIIGRYVHTCASLLDAGSGYDVLRQ